LIVGVTSTIGYVKKPGIIIRKPEGYRLASIASLPSSDRRYPLDQRKAETAVTRSSGQESYRLSCLARAGTTALTMPANPQIA
jgi:hypothetical protein